MASRRSGPSLAWRRDQENLTAPSPLCTNCFQYRPATLLTGSGSIPCSTRYEAIRVSESSASKSRNESVHRLRTLKGRAGSCVTLWANARGRRTQPLHRVILHNPLIRIFPRNEVAIRAEYLTERPEMLSQ